MLWATKWKGSARQDRLFRHTVVYITCLHETGHALGLPHTRAFADVMYSFEYGGNILEFFGRYRRSWRPGKTSRRSPGLSSKMSAVFWQSTTQSTREARKPDDCGQHSGCRRRTVSSSQVRETAGLRKSSNTRSLPSDARPNTTALHFFARMGGFGLVGFGILDSSFLFLPLGNDLLLIVLTARKPGVVLVLRADGGTRVGDRMYAYRCGKPEARRVRHGAHGQSAACEEHCKRRSRSTHGGCWRCCPAPPPFPFTVFLIAASGLQMSRWKVLGCRRYRTAGSLLRPRLACRSIRAAHPAHIRRPEVEYVVIGSGGHLDHRQRVLDLQMGAVDPPPETSPAYATAMIYSASRL